jgi:hypothetical protein
VVVRMFPHDRSLHPCQCSIVSHVVWMLQSDVVEFLRGTLNLPSYGHREYDLAQSNGLCFSLSQVHVMIF